ncbi:Hypothetical predicted protein [Pelobates cultripes]|uniref:Uncharacterized protein n=1 Tax=Pelobates cultripes TaxID=61616 RepID=A0AAD1QXF7_PELCU|nr:Hypothetical predicted protein [Pelobates cultripes]
MAVSGGLGGLGELHSATTEVQKICNQIHVGGSKYIHVRIFAALPDENKGPEVQNIQSDKGLQTTKMFRIQEHIKRVPIV